MEPDPTVDQIMYPLYGMFHIHDLKRPGKEELLARMIASIEQGLADPGLKLTEVLPELPRSEEAMRFHLTETLKRLKAQGRPASQSLRDWR